MARKFQIPKPTENIPEAIGMFEIHADKLFDKFDRASKTSLSAMEAIIKNKVDDHFTNQAKKEEISRIEHFEKQEVLAKQFYEKQEIKIGSLIEKAIDGMTKTIKWFLTIVLLVIGGFGGLTIINTVAMASKANTKEVLTLKDAEIILDLNDKYRDQRYVIKPGESIDKYNYKWYLETVFGRASRGIQTTTRAEDESNSK